MPCRKTSSTKDECLSLTTGSVSIPKYSAKTQRYNKLGLVKNAVEMFMTLLSLVVNQTQRYSGVSHYWPNQLKTRTIEKNI